MGAISASEYNLKASAHPSNFHWWLFALLFLTGAYLRSFAFFLPSNIGDPPSYQALAMKMNYGFMKQYNVLNYRMALGAVPGTIDYVWESDPQLWTAMRTRESNRRPLNMQPPLLPIMIWTSHGLLKHDGAYTSVAQNLGSSVVRHPPWAFLKAQGYAIAVPFLFSLLGLLLVYLFCLHYYSWREGILALLLLIPSPVDLAVGPKLYTDGILGTLAFLGVFVFMESFEKRRSQGLRMGLLAGVLLGFCFLTKLQGVLFAFAFLLISLLHPRQKGSWLDRLLDPRLLLSALACVVIAAPWNWLVYKTYGTPIPNTPQDPGNPWFRYVFGRPPYAYFLGMLYFLPACALGWGYGLICLRRPRKHFPESVFLLMSLFFLGMMIVFMKTGTAGLEHRYLLPIYPMIAILTARALNSLAQWTKRTFLQNALYVAFVFLLLGLGWHSAKYGLSYVFGNLVTFAPWGL